MTHTNFQKKLYEEIYTHFRSCDLAASNLSDTWTHTLEQKGYHYSLDEMLEMHALGNRVNSWIDDCNYLIDGSCLDFNDPITQALLEMGESDFGTPRKDITLLGKKYSSNFIHHVLLASKIIRSIQKHGIETPRILEIGGGLGGIQYLLRSYFKEKLTYFAVDIPETLLIQEWYLRNCFPETPSTFKGSKEVVSFVEGGFNFVNAYVVSTQDVPFNVAINIDSMQEMDDSTVKSYVKYIEKNLMKGGIFFCQNHYGHSSKGPSEPTEYVQSTHWDLEMVELSPQIECCTESEQLRTIYALSPKAKNPELRTWVLRFFWNAYLGGHLTSSHPVVPKLWEVANSENDLEKGIQEFTRILAQHKIDLPSDVLTNLKEHLYFSHKEFFKFSQTQETTVTYPAPDREKLSAAFWRLHLQLLGQMELAVSQGAKAQEILSLKTQSLQSLLENVAQTKPSEYWVTCLVGTLLALGEKTQALNVLQTLGKNVQSEFWQVRLASLFYRFRLSNEALACLAQISHTEQTDFFVGLNAIELLYLLGKKQEALELFDAYQVSNKNSVTQVVYLKTASLLGHFDLVTSSLNKNKELTPIKNIEIMETYLRFHSEPHRREEVANFLEHKFTSLELNSEAKFRLGLLLLKSSPEKGMGLVEENLKSFANNYFMLAMAGRFLQGAGLADQAKEALEKSAQLRPNAFLHFDFIGSVFFGAKRFTEAAHFFDKALSLKPYLRHIKARSLYSKLPADLRDTGVIGKSEDLELIFQRKQDFYNRLGPSSK